MLQLVFNQWQSIPKEKQYIRSNTCNNDCWNELCPCRNDSIFTHVLLSCLKLEYRKWQIKNFGQSFDKFLALTDLSKVLGRYF